MSGFQEESQKFAFDYENPTSAEMDVSDTANWSVSDDFLPLQVGAEALEVHHGLQPENSDYSNNQNVESVLEGFPVVSLEQTLNDVLNSQCFPIIGTDQLPLQPSEPSSSSFIGIPFNNLGGVFKAQDTFFGEFEWPELDQEDYSASASSSQNALEETMEESSDDESGTNEESSEEECETSDADLKAATDGSHDVLAQQIDNKSTENSADSSEKELLEDASSTLKKGNKKWGGPISIDLMFTERWTLEELGKLFNPIIRYASWDMFNKKAEVFVSCLLRSVAMFVEEDQPLIETFNFMYGGGVEENGQTRDKVIRLFSNIFLESMSNIMVSSGSKPYGSLDRRNYKRSFQKYIAMEPVTTTALAANFLIAGFVSYVVYQALSVRLAKLNVPPTVGDDYKVDLDSIVNYFDNFKLKSTEYLVIDWERFESIPFGIDTLHWFDVNDLKSRVTPNNLLTQVVSDPLDMSRLLEQTLAKRLEDSMRERSALNVRLATYRGKLKVLKDRITDLEGPSFARSNKRRLETQKILKDIETVEELMEKRELDTNQKQDIPVEDTDAFLSKLLEDSLDDM